MENLNIDDDNNFEKIKKIKDKDQEYWSALELSKILERKSITERIIDKIVNFVDTFVNGMSE